MDPINEAYQAVLAPKKDEKLDEMSKVPMDEMPKDKKAWTSEVTKLVNSLNNKFKPLTFTVEKIDWEEGNFKGAAFKQVRFTISISIDTAKSKYIDSVPYINLTDKFYKELKSVSNTIIGVDDIQFNNTGSTFWSTLTASETNG